MEHHRQHVHNRTLPDVGEILFVETLFSKNYSLAIGCFYILLCGQFINSALGHQGKSLEAFGSVRLLLANGITFLGVTLFLDLLLIPRYGIYGAAIGSSSGLVVANLLAYAEVHNLYRLNLMDTEYFRVMIILLITITALVVMRWLIGYTKIS